MSVLKLQDQVFEKGFDDEIGRVIYITHTGKLLIEYATFTNPYFKVMYPNEVQSKT